MSKKVKWQYDEFIQVGKDYSDQNEVEVYESTHSEFRNLKKESKDLLELLQPTRSDIIVDLGCGAGVFAIEAAKVCSKVYAVDVSQSMLEYAKNKARNEEITNIEFYHSGFLNFDLPDNSVNFITSTFSFHHLPDFWKAVALKKLSKMLGPGGKLYIKDVILEENNVIENIQYFINNQEKLGGNFLKEDAEQHFKEEFSTYGWIMDELLERSGFIIESKDVDNRVIVVYFCRKG